jgi:hypothetical protein
MKYEYDENLLSHITKFVSNNLLLTTFLLLIKKLKNIYINIMIMDTLKLSI